MAILAVAAALAVVVFAEGDAQESIPFEVQLESNVALGAPETGLHHVHLYYDTTTPDGPYDLVYGNTFEARNLTPGVHTILASLRNANHSDAGPNEIVTVTIVGGGEGAQMLETGASTTMPDMSTPATAEPGSVPNYGC